MIALADSSERAEAAPDDLATLSGTVADSRSLREAIAGLLQQPRLD